MDVSSGLCNPKTSSGEIDVDGIRATRFTRFFDSRTAQAWLAPSLVLTRLGIKPLSMATHGVHRLLW